MSDLAEVDDRGRARLARCGELVVVGMGKLGGRELNVSSDIDLVFVYPGRRPSARERSMRRRAR